MARDELALDFLEPPQREYLRKEAEKRKCSVAEVVRALVDSDIENNRQGAREPDPSFLGRPRNREAIRTGTRSQTDATKSTR